MRSLNLFCMLVVIVFSLSCKKNTTSGPKTKTGYLTAHTWIYNKFYMGYNSPPPTLYYQRGASNNTLDYHLNNMTFEANGNYTEMDESGFTRGGSWKLWNGDTEVQIITSQGAKYLIFLLIDDTHYNWANTQASSGTSGEMIPQ